MSLHLQAQVAERGVDITLDVPDGATLALVGPNASGKSTTLGLVAGLVVADRGVARLGDRILFDVDGSGRSTWVAPHRRRVALLAQDPLLFPNLDVLDNVAFGPRSSGAGRGEARQRAEQWLAEVGAADLAPRRVTSLSGGQQQRVALARALAAEPDVLLLDEPLAALDVDAAAAARQVLRRALTGRTAVLVSHDPLDIALLADALVVLESGRVVETGPVAQVASVPRSRFAASLFGLNVLRGQVVSTDALRTADGRIVHGMCDAELSTGTAAVAVFQPVTVAVFRSPPAGSPRNGFSATITGLEPQGHLVRVRTADLLADITPAAVAELGLDVGQSVHLVVKAAEVRIYPA